MKKLLPPRYFRRKARHHNRLHKVVGPGPFDVYLIPKPDPTHTLDAFRYALHSIQLSGLTINRTPPPWEVLHQ